MTSPIRLTPAMASRRRQVLDFCKRYVATWGEAPSYGEIAGAFGIDRLTVRGHIRSLVKSGDILRDTGDRRKMRFSTGPVMTAADAMLILAAEGWTVNTEQHAIEVAVPPTSSPLADLPFLDHIPETDAGVANDGDDSGRQSDPGERDAGYRRARTPPRGGGAPGSAAAA